MVDEGETICPNCGAELKFYDYVNRIKKSEGAKVEWIGLRRLRCTDEDCRKVHREITKQVVRFKHYEARIIKGVIYGLITSDTEGFEERPSEDTMNRWIKERSKIL